MKVIAEIQSTIDATGHGEGHGLDNPPVDMQWYNGDDRATAISAVAQVVCQGDCEYTRTVGIRIEF